ncbi:MAG: FAD binding domain-containing protein [Treponema sp.]|jgi:carbon-monoxide dehydrogenase medium subunit/xanthine dehydrogenase FAD-binding subunit|nr:FAD binding domain-containing protein [Treponema sp.]
MKDFDFHTPGSLREALVLLAKYNPSTSTRSAVIAGGTDVVIELRDFKRHPEHVININKLNELRYCKFENGKVRIGPLTTFADLERDAGIREKVKSLHYCASNVGSPQIRNLGTIGGNVINASPAGDSISTLMSLDASVVLESGRGRREMKLQDFYAHCQKTQLAPDELLTEIYFDAPTNDIATAAYKLGKRKSLAIVVVGFSVLIERDSSDRIKRSQIVLGASSKIPVRINALEDYVLGKPLTEDTFKPCGGMLSEIIKNMIPEKDAELFEKYHKVESIKSITERTFRRILDCFERRREGK